MNVPPAPRMEIPDVLRGLALLGVLSANMLAFDGLVHLPAAEVRAMTRGIDGIALMAIDAVFRRKALTLLSFLFGLGLLGHVGPALCIPLSIAIFAAQIVASRLWLTRFRLGPLEWVWRSLTYGRQPILRRA